MFNSVLIRFFLIINFLFTIVFSSLVHAELADTVEKVKPSIVGIGVHTPAGRPQNILYGSGFAIGNGKYVITNHHVIDQELDDSKLQKLAVFTGSGKSAVIIKAQLVASSKQHDIAILEVQGRSLVGMSLGEKAFIREGTDVAFTGFPIGAVLGLYPVTHKGIIASVTPTITPVDNSQQISIQMLKQLRNPYLVYQLDATAYPGNSGSAVYDIKTGEVVGIINKVFVQQSKETVISNPSGITYAIPVKYLLELLEKNSLIYQ